MELYIEKKFLDFFNSNFNHDFPSKTHKILANILQRYGSLEWFIDCKIDNDEELELLKIENLFFASRASYSSPICIYDFEKHFFEKSECAQTLIFTFDNKIWFADAEKKGALCFCYNNFEDKIDKIVSECENLKVDLSELFQGWNFFNSLKKIPKNKIIINDQFLYAENSGNKPFDENLIPLIKNITQENTDLRIDFFANYLNGKPVDILKMKSKLQNVFNRDYKMVFEFIQYFEHDRILYSNFFMIECGVGFNFNVNKTSNSTILVQSIFDEFTYKRMRNHLIKLDNMRTKSVIK